METTTILCILLLSLYLALAIFWIVRWVIDVAEDLKRDKRNAEWEAERLQLDKERAARDEEYHQKRMEQFNK